MQQTQFNEKQNYTAFDIRKALEWGMKPLLDLMDAATVRQILLQEVEEEKIEREIDSIRSIHFKNFHMNKKQIDLLLQDNGMLRLTKKGKEESILTTKGRKFDSSTCIFFKEHLDAFLEIATYYQDYFPDKNDSLFSAHNYRFPIDDHSSLEFHPFYPSIVTFPFSSSRFPSDRLYEIMIAGKLITEQMRRLLDTDYLNGNHGWDYQKIYEHTHRYCVKGEEK